MSLPVPARLDRPGDPAEVLDLVPAGTDVIVPAHAHPDHRDRLRYDARRAGLLR